MVVAFSTSSSFVAVPFFFTCDCFRAILVCVVSPTSCEVVTSRPVVKLVDVVSVSICKIVDISRAVLVSPVIDVVVSKEGLVVVCNSVAYNNCFDVVLRVPIAISVAEVVRVDTRVGIEVGSFTDIEVVWKSLDYLNTVVESVVSAYVIVGVDDSNLLFLLFLSLQWLYSQIQ